MHKLEMAILNKFKNQPEKEYSTTQIVQSVFPEQGNPEGLEMVLSKGDLLKAKREKAQQHRKLLYHLNKLVEEGILKTTKTLAKGEKCFALAIEEGELVIGKSHKKIIISKSASSAMPIESYERREIIKRFGGEGWATQLNTVLLESEEFAGLNRLLATINDGFANINDAIGINSFEKLIDNSTKQQVREFLEQLNIDTKDYEKRVTLIINTAKIINEQAFAEFAQSFADVNPSKISTVFNLDTKELGKKSYLFEKIIRMFSDKKIKINIKNNLLSPSPFIVGNAGIYNFDEEDWKHYQKELKGKVKGLACSQASMVVDHSRFFQHYKTIQEFRNLILKSLKTLVIVNTMQRRKTHEYFRHLLEINKKQASEFFVINRNYLRFWNYNLEGENEMLINLLKSCKETTEEFCKTQETIFKSCGVPARFKVAFSSAFKKSDTHLTERVYSKNTIKSLEDFYKQETAQNLKLRENLINIFQGGDRVRFFRSGEARPSDIIREFHTILTSFQLPFFCYDFSSLQGSIKLTQFFK